MRPRTAAAALLVAMIWIAGPGIASAQTDYTPDPDVDGQLIVDQAESTPGGVVTGSGTVGPNERVEIRVAGRVLTTVTADASGHFTFTITLPSDVEGTVEIQAVSPTHQLSTVIMVRPALLAATGASSTSFVATGWALVVAGLCFVFLGVAVRMRIVHSHQLVTAAQAGRSRPRSRRRSRGTE